MIWLVEDPEAFQGRKIRNVKFIRLVPESYPEKIRYYYYLSSARFAFYTHRSPPLKFNRGEVFINLWHGSGIKRPASLDMGRNFDYVLCSSDYFKEIRIRNFSIQADKLLPLGNPRNDLFFEKTDALEKIIDRRFSKVILWMPTFRATKNGRPEFINYDTQNRKLPIVDCEEKLKELAGVLAKHDTLLIIKTHPMEDLTGIKSISSNNMLIMTNSDLDKKQVMLYSLLKESNALITDISSVYVDYLLLDRPIGFTVNDMDDYKSGYNVEDPLSLMPGKLIYDFPDFLQFITDVITEKDIYKEKRIEINALFNKYRDGFSKRIIEYFNIT